MEKATILEQEIAALSRAIEEKRSILAAERGIVMEREILTRVMEDYAGPITAPIAAPPSAPAVSIGSYLDTLDPGSVAKVNELVAGISEQGLKSTIHRARQEIPYILDAFHDALITYLYDELKLRGIIK